MKAFCDITIANPNPRLCFGRSHMFGALVNHNQTCYTDSVKSDTTHYLCMDGGYVRDRLETVAQYRKDGMKIIMMIFDPSGFPLVDSWDSVINFNKIILFDQKYQNRFPGKTYILDYYFNENLFPKVEKNHSKEVCVFGHLSHGRHNDYNVPKVDYNISSYEELYGRVVRYNGVAVYDTGLDENGRNLTTHNKAKAVETLMCGRNPYCKSGINTKRYNKYLKKYEQIPHPVDVDFEQEEIFKLNKETIEELIHFCES